jgi:hypothetical protein
MEGIGSTSTRRVDSGIAPAYGLVCRYGMANAIAPFALPGEFLVVSISVALLWLFVINLGIVVGAGLYENRVVVPQWASAPPHSLLAPDSGLRFWAFATTGALTLLTLANLGRVAQ